MTLEHLKEAVGQIEPAEMPESKLEDLESERPLEAELPQLEGLEDAEVSLDKWELEDGGRIEAQDLPSLESADIDVGIESSSETLEGEAPGLDEIEKSGNAEESRDVDDEYYSSYEERIKQTPREDSDRGEWSGERGESDFIPFDEKVKEILHEYGLDRILYENGIPDFSGVSESTVEIDMTEDRAENFRQCDEKCAEQWNQEARDGRTDWTARDVKEWRQENGYSWHERNDMNTCDLIPTKINDYFGHLGGVSECKKRDASDSEGDDFDE